MAAKPQASRDDRDLGRACSINKVQPQQQRPGYYDLCGAIMMPPYNQCRHLELAEEGTDTVPRMEVVSWPGTARLQPPQRCAAVGAVRNKVRQ